MHELQERDNGDISQTDFRRSKGEFISSFPIVKRSSRLQARLPYLQASKHQSLFIYPSKQAHDPRPSKQACDCQVWRLLACGHHCSGIQPVFVCFALQELLPCTTERVMTCRPLHPVLPIASLSRVWYACSIALPP